MSGFGRHVRDMLTIRHKRAPLTKREDNGACPAPRQRHGHICRVSHALPQQGGSFIAVEEQAGHAAKVCRQPPHLG